jgi:hypothetical protein
MKTGSQSTILNLDILALSLLCCLLASVVGVLVLSGEEVRAEENRLTEERRRAEERKRRDEQERIFNELHQQTARIQVDVEEVEHSREAIVAKLNYAVLERGNRALKSRSAEIQQKISLIRRLATAKVESQRLAKELEKKEKVATTTLTPEARRMLGEYKGRYVLVECVEDAAIIYPGQERVAIKPSKAQVERLLNQITKAGFVAFVVRPSGWYDNSYDKLKAIIYAELDKIEKEGERTVGRSSFPLDTVEPIANYLPPEHSP